MVETVRDLPDQEQEVEAVEIKLGTVVEFLDGENAGKSYVIIDPQSDEEFQAAEVLRDEEGNEELAGVGGHGDPVKGVGEWSFEKVVRGYLGHYKKEQAQEQLEALVHRNLEDYAAKPSIMYTGEPQ